jgi:hypothetical protein
MQISVNFCPVYLYIADRAFIRDKDWRYENPIF